MASVTLTLPDGSTREYPAGVTGQEVAESIGRRLAADALAVGIDGETWDLSRPITHDAAIRIYTWADDEGRRAYWHSSAHLMAEAVEQLFPGTKFGIGPAIEEGFYYDIDVGDHPLTAEDLERIETTDARARPERPNLRSGGYRMGSSRSAFSTERG